MTRAERHALGRRLLAEGGALWSALPVEWPTEGAKGSVADPPELPGFAWRVWTSLGALLRRPRASFAHVHEPVAHGAVLRLLQALRLPLWLGLLAALGLRAWLMPGGSTLLRPVHAVLDPRLCEALSLWLLLMVPIGMPLLSVIKSAPADPNPIFFRWALTRVASVSTSSASRGSGVA